jgi:ribosomal protein S14
VKVLFFSPHSAIWVHAFPEALVAEALAQQGNEIVYVGCGGLLKSHCIPMAAAAIPFDAPPSTKERLCRLCGDYKGILRKRFELSGMDLTDIVTEEDFRIADDLSSSVTRENCLDLMLDGIEVGRISTYELLLQNKKIEISFDENEWRQYRASVRNAILVLRVMRRIIELTQPDRIVVYNALYSPNRIVCRLAELAGIPQYFLHAGDNLSNRLQRLIIARGEAFAYYGYLRDKWKEVQNQPIPLDAMRSGTDHFLEVAKGRSVWAYSAAPGKDTDLRQRFGVAPGQKIICAVMSSSDERFSGELIGVVDADIPLIFATQVDWIRALIGYVEGRENLALIIRVHPREFPNKREGVLSEHARILQAVLADLPPNVKVNWPTDHVSLYDLANIADVFANGWSTAGKEMAWLGLPVVLYSNDLTLYPPNLNYVGTTEPEYFRRIEQALNDGWDPERIRKTYRWCALEYKCASVDISESFARSEHRSFIARASGKLLRGIFPTHEQEADCRNRAAHLLASERINRMLRDQMRSILDLDELDTTVSHAQETGFLKQEVRRLAEGIFGAADDTRQGTLAGKLRKFADS